VLQGIRDPNNEIEVMSYSKVHVRSQKFLEKESHRVRDNIKGGLIYEEITSMYMGPLVKEKCMNMVIKISRHCPSCASFIHFLYTSCVPGSCIWGHTWFTEVKNGIVLVVHPSYNHAI
jgi:hypothetical protein